VSAATYYVDNTCINNGNGTAFGCAASADAIGAFNSITNVVAKSGGYSPGDFIDGQNKTYYERLVVPSSGDLGGYITFRNFTLDGTLSFDGSWSFNPTNTYSNISPWSNQSGEIYKKTSTRPPYMFFEDSAKLTPIATTDLTGALTLARGQFTWNNNTLYYRALDGGTPATHLLRASRRDLDGLPGLIYASGKNYLKFENITVKNNSANTVPSHAVLLVGCDHIDLNGVNIANNTSAVDINAVTNLIISSSSNISDNITSGVMIEGNSSNLDISGTYNNNGRHLNYNSVSLAYGADGDNIGIGGIGGAISNITIHDAIITNAGAPDGDLTAYGAGIYLGTANSMTVSNFNVLRSKISGNHTSGIYAQSNQFLGGVISSNLIYGNINNSGTQNALHIGASGASFGSVDVDNNVIAFNHGNAGLYINNNVGTINVRNNLFYDNGQAGAYRADLWLQQAANNIIESNNSFYRSGSAWDITKLIEKAGVVYDINHIIGSSAGYWQFVSGQGTNDMVGDIKFVNPASFDFHLQSTSPAINAGTDVGLTTDYDGNPKSGASWDIGAYEFQDSTAPTTTADTNTGLYNSTQTITLTCDDGAGVGCDKIYYTTNGDVPTTSSTQYTTPISIPTTTTLKFFAQDRNQNSETSQTKIYTIDTTFPETAIDSYPDSTINTTSATFTFSADETATFQCKLDSGNYASCTTPKNYASLAEGAHTFYVKAIDTATNEDATPAEYSFTVDTEIPTISNLQPDSTTFLVTTTSTNLTATTSETTICKYAIDPTATYADMTIFDTTNTTSHSTAITNLNPGTTYNYYLICKDQINESAKTHLTFSIAPLENTSISLENIKIKINREANKFKDKIYSWKNKFKLKNQDSALANGQVKIYRNNKKVATINVDEHGFWSKLLKFRDDFSGTLKIRQYDQYGTLVSSQKEKIEVDTEKPVFTLFPKLFQTVIRGTQIHYQATDNQEIKKYKITLGGYIKNTTSAYYEIPQNMPTGLQLLIIKVTDTAGNATTQKTWVRVR
jgi:hypothetical protein